MTSLKLESTVTGRMQKEHQAKKKNMCVYGPPTDPNFWPDPKFFMALLVEYYLNALFLPSNVVFDV